MVEKLHSVIAVIGIDIGKNSLHVVGLDERGAVLLRQKWSRGQVETRFANLPVGPPDPGSCGMGWNTPAAATMEGRSV
jgi:hypothetical protein